MDFLIVAVVYFLVFALGASVGSFLSVVVHRVPAKLSIVRPASRCPVCRHQLTPKENIPILGWWWLKGRCSSCRIPIPWRYPLLEAVCGIVFVFIFVGFGLSWQTLGYWLFFGWLLALSLIDLDTMTLPNSLTFSGLVAGLLFQWVVGWSTTGSIAGGIPYLMQGILGAVVGLWLLNIIEFFGTLALGQTAMGAGDAKLAAMMGAWIGWRMLLLAGFLACIVGAVSVGIAIALGLLERRKPFPFGPFLALGGLIAAIWGQAIIAAYLQLFFPSF